MLLILFLTAGLCLAAALPAAASAATAPTELQWPPVERQMRPWTRWWWLGSAVDRENLDRLLETYHAAGLGGVEITPIYGVQGQERRDIPYLSPRWLEMLRFTIEEAHRLDMGVDMPTGSGWPFGGPGVTEADAQDRLVLEKAHADPGSPFTREFGTAIPQGLVAVSGTGQQFSLLDRVDAAGKVEWTPPTGSWTVYLLSHQWSGMKVKRAAPGGEGRCINPFSASSVDDYLAEFDQPLSRIPAGGLRSQFHDSFEYQANWAPELLEEFRKRRGYDLRDHLPAFAGDGDPDEVARVKTDYRETVGEMLLEHFTLPWREWAHRHGSLARNQAHGSPGNLLDLYGAVDIPETEIFRSIGDVRISKFASSAAHVMGHPLASSESCTWLGEHFTVSLAQCKAALDRLLVAGINHIFYHGTAYSPSDAAWPGWLFYASTHFEPTNTIWHDFPALNAYVARCQSILQSGQPDNDVLLYWPLQDAWQKHPDLFTLPIEGKWFEGEPVAAAAQELWDKGYGFDYVSDRQLGLVHVDGGRIHLPGGSYRAVVVPSCTYIPVETLSALVRLARAGATVAFQSPLPSDVPGLANLDQRRAELHALLAQIQPEVANRSTIHETKIGAGSVLIGGSADALLSAAHIQRETLADIPGLHFIRRREPDGASYFLVNQGQQPIDGWLPLATPAASAVILDPMTGATGVALVRVKDEGQRTENGSNSLTPPPAHSSTHTPTHPDTTYVCLQLQSGESLILRTYSQKRVNGPGWRYVEPAGPTIPLRGTWEVRFLQGGPDLPPPFRTDHLESWTTQDGEAATRFGGTARYALRFDLPDVPAEEWWLELGRVCESARMRLNGRELGTLIAPPFRVRLEGLQKTGNLLEVDVTNLAANRIREMDRRGVRWRIFREINFVNIDYKPFDASQWPVRDSGLLGPVSLVPMKAIAPTAAP